VCCRNKHDEEAVPDLVSFDNASRLYGSAYRVLDIIELERLAFDTKILIRQFQMNREPLRVNRLGWDRAVHER